MIVNTGKNYAAERIAGNAANKMLYFAIGTGTTSETASDTALSNEVSRVEVTDIDVASNVGEAKYTVIFPTGTGTGTITEAGLFDSSSGGTMFSRFTFSAINKTAQTAIEIVYTLTAT